MKEYIKVYTPHEYREALMKLNERGCTWRGGRKLFYKCGRPTSSFSSFYGGPFALVVHEDGHICVDEIRHCPDPTDRRLEETHLKVGDKVVMTDCYGEYYDHKDEIFEITSLKMIGLTPCAFLDHGGLGAYACDGLRRI